MGKNKDKVEPTAQEIALTEISRKQLDRYQEVFAPFEDEWLKESRVSAGEKEQLQGQIAGDVAQKAAGERKALSGMNPASGAFTAGARDLATAEARVGGRAAAEGTMQAENADVSALMSGVRLGRGEAVQAQAGMEQMAGQSVSRAISKSFLDRASRDANADMVGSGMGVLAYGASKGMAPSGVSDTDLVDIGGSVGARNASRHLGNGLVP